MLKNICFPPGRTGETWLGGAGAADSPAGGAASSRTPGPGGDAGGALVIGGRALHCHRHDILPPEQHEPQHPLLLPLRGLGRLGLELAELLTVAEDDVHVLVERLELADEGAPVL